MGLYFLMLQTFFLAEGKLISVQGGRSDLPGFGNEHRAPLKGNQLGDGFPWGRAISRSLPIEAAACLSEHAR